ncbi:hypothetical protein KIL84_018892 [Mauremys mutica]|uniref:Uncharacterized protein n=1 Tax=Mauremys mutica TaxID=74926 RepID=A0A9D3XVK1_9SAUR|nr:hypothetical protein KIL84_018892 [Mauremys mutica]
MSVRFFRDGTGTGFAGWPTLLCCYLVAMVGLMHYCIDHVKINTTGSTASEGQTDSFWKDATQAQAKAESHTRETQQWVLGRPCDVQSVALPRKCRLIIMLLLFIALHITSRLTSAQGKKVV